ncbi:MAG: matrixin family metalloprotease, partial [Planctomycetota bacterium]|nr:matrixin family metalloprotease [Planctomycetota bacterium]
GDDGSPYIENTTGDTGAGQRTALINGMAAWTGIVQITFREICLPNRNVAVDWAYRTLDHSAFEGAEAGDPDCPFDGAGGVLAHAGFPPGVNSTCINPMAETFAGNVHFDDDDLYEQDNAGGFGPFSITLIAAHEVGHSIGLVHDSGGGGPHIMRPGFSSNDASQAPSASDTANLQGGYAAGSGSVVTLNNSGVWVDNGFFGTERGNNSTNPVNTFLEGVNGVPDFTSNVIVHIEAGTYQQAITITQSMFLQAENGTVIIE